ncbi:MAG: family 43 glycosylhydrolase [Oscillospiraceae bacterium]|nr:family 43 glycosylhydrolase [Oscillospiraceae bacterium]
MPTSPLLKHSAVLSPKKAAKKSSEIDLSALRVRDPYIFSDANTHTYYLFYNSFHTYCLESKDLLHWDNCRVAFHNDGAFDQNWASEVHAYNGHYYLFSALRKDASDQRGCYILKADMPYGPYRPWSERLTPRDKSCIDGTLFVENGTPYMVYCDEYINYDNEDGRMAIVQLSADLKRAEGQHKILFHARDNPFSENGVTDAPFLYRATDGSLVMLWSKYKNSRYAIISAVSHSGIFGPWQQNPEALFDDDGGHAMVFPKFEGGCGITFHAPNCWSDDGIRGRERVVIRRFVDENGKLSIAL